MADFPIHNDTDFNSSKIKNARLENSGFSNILPMNLSTTVGQFEGQQIYSYGVAYVWNGSAWESSATKLKTARTINGVSFDGTQNITIPSGTESIQLLGNYDSLNTLSDGMFCFTNGNYYYNFPDLQCGTLGIGTASGKEILRQYTIPDSLIRVQIMMIEHKTYRRGNTINSYTWSEWRRLVTCDEMSQYVTKDDLEIEDAGELDERNPKVDISRDTQLRVKDDKINYDIHLLDGENKFKSWFIGIEIEPISTGGIRLDFTTQLGSGIRIMDAFGVQTIQSYLDIPSGVTFISLRCHFFPPLHGWVIKYTFIY